MKLKFELKLKLSLLAWWLVGGWTIKRLMLGQLKLKLQRKFELSSATITVIDKPGHKNQKDTFLTKLSGSGIQEQIIY